MDEKINNTFQDKIEKIRSRCTFDFIKLAFFQMPKNCKQVKQVYASGNISKRYLRMVIQTRIGLAGQVMKTGRPAFVIDVDKEIKPHNLQQYPIIMAEGLKSLGAVPLFESNQVIGVVLAGFRTSNKMTEERIHRFITKVKHEFKSLKDQELVNNDASNTSILTRDINKSIQ